MQSPAVWGLVLTLFTLGTSVRAESALPDVSLKSLAGERVSLAGIPADVLVVDLWATWCEPCIKALPHLDALGRDFGARGVRIVAVSQDESEAAVREMVEHLGLEHLLILHDPNNVVAEALQPPTMPTTYIFGPGRVLHTVFAGYRQGDERRVRQTLETLARADGGTLLTRERAPLMATAFRIQAFVETARQEEAIDAALDEVARLERRWSPWIAGSELARINAGAHARPVIVEQDTMDLLLRSRAVCDATERAFDPTFFALDGLYDFRQQPFVPPTPAQVSERLALVNCRYVELDAKAGGVRLARAGVRIHLGGNAKGTALDVAAAILIRAGISRFVIDGGGDVVAAGRGPKGPWRVGVQHPRKKRGQLIAVLTTTGGAVATSGDYERFAVLDGIRYHHIIDPRTGTPATGCMSATVVASPGPHAGERADAWATALCVLGPTAGFPRLLAAGGLQAAVYTTDGKLHRTPGFVGDMRDSVR